LSVTFATDPDFTPGDGFAKHRGLDGRGMNGRGINP
jgi:hypothetical protein